MTEAVVIAVTGGRDYDDRERVFAKLDKYHERYKFTHLLHGSARGLDSLADAWTDTKRGVQSVSCRAHWSRDRKAAGAIRNHMMAVLRPKVLLAFPGGAGTSDMVKQCQRLGIKVIHINGR